MKQIKDRIAQLAQSAGVELEAPLNRCWVESRILCPYGQPQGQYSLRPEGFCAREQCMHFPQEIIPPEDLKEKQEVFLIDHFKDQHVTVTSELRARAEELPEKSSERQILILATDIIEAHELDRKILLEDDLPTDPR